MAVDFILNSEAFPDSRSMQGLLPTYSTVFVIAFMSQTGEAECVEELCDEDSVSSVLLHEEPESCQEDIKDDPSLFLFQRPAVWSCFNKANCRHARHAR